MVLLVMKSSKDADKELSDKAKAAMINHDYQVAFNYLQQMAKRDSAMKMQRLVIQHQQNYLRKK